VAGLDPAKQPGAECARSSRLLRFARNDIASQSNNALARPLGRRHPQRASRAAASRVSSSPPQWEKRRKRLPWAWSKSTPGVAAMPTSASMRVQNAVLSFDRSAMSANR
jgi:hypothetical protein